MKILGIDFSTSQRAVALVDCDAGKAKVLAALTENGTRETHAFGMMEQVLQSAGISREAVEALAVGIGPGSYGGIRVALAIAQGWQLAKGIKVAGIPSTLAIAEQARSNGVLGEVNVIVDAQRDEFYLARFLITADATTEQAPLELITRARVEEAIAHGARVIGPDVEFRVQTAQPFYPSAVAIAEQAHRANEFVDANTLAPVYLRPVSFVKAPTPRTDL